MPADSSQLEAIAAATAGRTFRARGHPGTGKSQTITNLLAKSIADGRRVLFVAEKRAALQVVQRRLDAVGLAPFTLDLHDKGAKPAEVRARLREALAQRPRVDHEAVVRTGDAVSQNAAASAGTRGGCTRRTNPAARSTRHGTRSSRPPTSRGTLEIPATSRHASPSRTSTRSVGRSEKLRTSRCEPARLPTTRGPSPRPEPIQKSCVPSPTRFDRAAGSVQARDDATFGSYAKP